MELEVLLTVGIWILFNTGGLAYGVKVFLNTRSDYLDVFSGLIPVTEGQQHQARNNRRLARTLLSTVTSFWLIGIIAIGFAVLSDTPNQSLGRVIRWGLILGDLGIVYALYVLDSSRTKLRAIVGGRRDSDKRGLEDGNSDQMGMPNP